MVFLSRVVSHDAEQTVCAVEVDEQEFFRDPGGGVKALAGLEYMAQCISAHTGLVARARGVPPLLGILLGSRRVNFHRPRYHQGESLEVTARMVWGEIPGTLVFDCSIAARDSGEPVADARLKCWIPPEGVGLEDFG